PTAPARLQRCESAFGHRRRPVYSFALSVRPTFGGIRMHQDPSSPALADQIVLVTGGARGLGEHISRAFLRESARVVINYLTSEKRAVALVDEFPELAYAAQADVCEPPMVQAIFERAHTHF